MVDIWAIFKKTHRNDKIASATSGTLKEIQTTSMNQILNQHSNTVGFTQWNNNDECKKWLKHVEFDKMHQILLSLC